MFPKSRNSHDWDKAKQSKFFKFSKLRGYKSWEFYWYQKCKDCAAQYLDSESDSFDKKCGCYYNVVDHLRPLHPIIAEVLR